MALRPPQGGLELRAQLSRFRTRRGLQSRLSKA